MSQQVKVDKVFNIDCEEGLYKKWLEIINFELGLTERELGVAALILEERAKLARAMDGDMNKVDRYLFSAETKKIIREKSGNMSPQYFTSIFNKLKEIGLIKTGVINSAYFPKRNSNGEYNLLLRLKYE